MVIIEWGMPNFHPRTRTRTHTHSHLIVAVNHVMWKKKEVSQVFVMITGTEMHNSSERFS